MYTIVNFLSFVTLTFFSIRAGDPVGIVLSIIGFTILIIPCEEMDLRRQEHNNKHKIGETWPSKNQS